MVPFVRYIRSSLYSPIFFKIWLNRYYWTLCMSFYWIFPPCIACIPKRSENDWIMLQTILICYLFPVVLARGVLSSCEIVLVWHSISNCRWIALFFLYFVFCVLIWVDCTEFSEHFAAVSHLLVVLLTSHRSRRNSVLCFQSLCSVICNYR